MPLVVLIGGATGVGKSTIATQIATRLGIVRVIPSDAVREVMRGLFSRELMPTLYTSSFDADSALREPPTRGGPVVVGFREQTAAVTVGLRALMERAAVEGTSMIIEGAHVVPGFVDVARFVERVLAVPVVITVEDEQIHRNHFAARSADSAARPFDRYLEQLRQHPADPEVHQEPGSGSRLAGGADVQPGPAMAAVIDLVVDRATAGSRRDARRRCWTAKGGRPG